MFKWAGCVQILYTKAKLHVHDTNQTKVAKATLQVDVLEVVRPQ